MAAETNVPGKTTTGLDRTNDTMLTTDDGLTRVDEATGVITAIAPKSQIEFFTGLDPYKTESVAKQCERFYKVADFAWDAATMTDVLVAEVAFPYALLQQPFIQDKFKDYKMMRADIEYYIRSTSAAWNYGALMWGQVENYYRSTTSYNNDNGLFRTINTVALSQCKGFELDATTGESQRRTLRLQGQRGYQRITSATNTATDQPGWIGSIFCRVLNQLESASGTTPGDVTVQVFARFKNLELAGYSPAVDMARSVKFQSALTKEAERKVDVFEGVKTAKKTIEGLIGSVKDIASTMPMISELLGSVGTVVAFDKPSTVDTPKPVYTNQSASMTYGSGIDLSTKAALSPSAGLCVSPSIFGGDFINPSLLEVLMQPTLLRTIKFSPTSPAKDVWTSFPLGPATCAKVKDAVGGYDRVYQPTYMAYYSRFFKKWRGSIKVLLTFKTSPNVSCDFRVAHFPEIKSFVAPLDDYDGDIVSELVPIKGPTSWGRAFGYVEENNYLDCGELGDTDPAKYIGLFAISRASAMSTMGDTVDANIYCNVYIMAGPDFQFLQHVSDGNSFEVIDPHATQDLPSLESQSNLRDMCAQPFPGMRQMSPNPESGFVNPDPVGSITTLFKRYGNMFQSNPALGGPFNIGFCDDYDTADTALTHLALPFLFWRGGIRVALPSIPSDQRPWIIYPDTTLLDGDTPLDASRSGLVLGGAAGSTVFYEHPQYTGEFFYKTCPLAPGNPKSPIHIGQLGTGTTPATDDIWRRGLFAAADDFMIANLSACPPIGVYASSADVKKGKGKEKMENKSDKLKMAESLRLSESTMDKLKSFIAVSSSPSKTK